MRDFLNCMAVQILAGCLLVPSVAMAQRTVTPTKLKQITSTIQDLRNMLDSTGRFAKDDNDTFLKDMKRWDQRLTGSKRHFSVGLQSGLAALDGADPADFAHPMLLTASFLGTRGNVQLNMFWLSSTNHTARVYVENAQGKVLAESPVASSEEGGEMHVIWQNGGARLSADGNKKLPQLALDLKELDQDIWVGLIEKDGTRTKPIEAFVDERLRKPAATQEGSDLVIAARIATTISELRDRMDADGLFKEDEDDRFLEKVKRRDQRLSGAKQYMSQRFQFGLAALAKAKVNDFKHPTVLIAMFQARHTRDVIEDVLVLRWLASSNTTAGVYVQNSQGKVLAEGAIATYEIDEIEASGPMELLQIGIARTTEDGDKDSPLLKLESRDLGQELWVGLIEKDGSRTRPIQAFVDEKLRIEAVPKN